MTLQTRLLPPDEWGRLDGTELETVYPYLDRMRSNVIVVEEADKIVGCWALFPLIHAEGVWVSPEHRGKSAVARRLLVAMRRTAREMGAQAVNTAAASADVNQMLITLGAIKITGAHYAIRLGD